MRGGGKHESGDVIVDETARPRICDSIGTFGGGAPMIGAELLRPYDSRTVRTILQPKNTRNSL